MTITFDPANQWGWYELCKRWRVQDLAHLLAVSGVFPLPPAAIEGFEEWQLARKRIGNNRA